MLVLVAYFAAGLIVATLAAGYLFHNTDLDELQCYWLTGWSVLLWPLTIAIALILALGAFLTFLAWQAVRRWR